MVHYSDPHSVYRPVFKSSSVNTVNDLVTRCGQNTGPFDDQINVHNLNTSIVPTVLDFTSLDDMDAKLSSTIGILNMFGIQIPTVLEIYTFGRY